MMLHPSKPPGTDIDVSVYRELFFEEAAAFLGILRDSLASLENDPTDESARQEAHRATHTLKGMASTMRYLELAALAESMDAMFVSNSILTTDQLAALWARGDDFEADMEILKTITL